MPKLYIFGQYVIFFWVGEDNEPVHVHVSVRRPEKNATKIWLTRRGGCQIANNDSHIPKHELNEIIEFISYNHQEICERWKETFGSLSFRF